MPTKEDYIQTILEVASELSKEIKRRKEIPEGILYAPLMGHLRLDEFEAILQLLEKNKRIRRENYVIYWIGD